jgi:pyruvate/2-oxoglutarate/acetoin dehydrogenase E1 component
MREISYSHAIREALQEEMRRDPGVFLIGEDIGRGGGAFRVTDGLLDEFGPERVVDTPISESAIAGAAMGAAMLGLRPVAEIMLADLMGLALDQVVAAAKIHYVHAGRLALPLVVRTANAGEAGWGPYHGQSTEGWLLNVPGLYLVLPATPYDAKGLLKAAIRDPNPVIFFEDKGLYPIRGPVPEHEYTVPLGLADVKREGDDVTIVAIARGVHTALRAADALAQRGIEAEVIDPRTLVPLDRATILTSLEKTGRLVIVHESAKRGGPGAEIAAMAAEEALEYLAAPIVRVANPDVIVPFSPVLWERVIPTPERVVAGVEKVMAYAV